MLISAVILTWNSEQHLERCLCSLFKDAQDSNLEIEVLVFDNGSQDRSLQILQVLQRDYSDCLRIFALQENLGTTVPRNMGIRQSHGDYILILDSDTEVQPGALRTLLEAFTKYEKVGLVAPRLLNPDGTIQPSCKRFPTMKTKLFKTLPSNVLKRWAEDDELFDKGVYNHSSAFHPDYCIAAAWLLRREVIDAVGFFEERFFYAPEDVDYCLRVWLAGWRVLHVPAATVVHYAQRLSYQKPRLAWEHIKGLYYYFRKHGYWWHRETLYAKIKERLAPSSHTTDPENIL